VTAFISHTSIDCRNAFDLSQWWKEVLGYQDVPGDPNEPGHEECMIVSTDGGPALLFIEVPEPKAGKNRLHLDLRPTPGLTRDEELDRLLGLGASTVEDRRTLEGRGWVVLADPEGNEFCILRSEAEMSAGAGTDA
jgi:catechol 2,3-dioxygenase-like lactoylglutathione lyase family enzyme